MRKVVVHQAKPDHESATDERLVSLLVTGLQRLLDKEGVSSPANVDFRAEPSVTTTCPIKGHKGRDA